MEDVVLGIGHNRTGVQHVVIEGNISCIKGKFRGENTFPGRAHRNIPGLLPAVNSLHVRGLDLPVKEQSSIQIECHQFFHGIPQVCAVAKNHGMRARYKSLPERASRWFACGHSGLLGERQEPKVGTSNTDGEEAEDNPDGVNPLAQQPHAQEA